MLDFSRLHMWRIKISKECDVIMKFVTIIYHFTSYAGSKNLGN
jgi:hypothetical protein